MPFSPLPSRMATVSCAIMSAMVSGRVMHEEPNVPNYGKKEGC